MFKTKLFTRVAFISLLLFWFSVLSQVGAWFTKLWDENFARWQNYNEIAVANNWDIFVVYDDSTCGRRGVSVKKKAVSSDVWTKVWDDCLSLDTVWILSIDTNPATNQPYIVFRDSMATKQVKAMSFNWTNWEQLSSVGLVQWTNVGLLELHFTKNWILYLLQHKNWVAYVKEYTGSEWINKWTFSTSWAKIDSDANWNVLVLINNLWKLSVKRFVSWARELVWTAWFNLRISPSQSDIAVKWNDIYVIYPNAYKTLYAYKFNWTSRSAIWSTAKKLKYSKVGWIWFTVTDNNIVFVSYTTDDLTLEISRYDGSSRYSVYNENNFNITHSDLTSIQNAVLVSYWINTPTHMWTNTNVMQYGDFTIIPSVVDLTISDLDLAYGYGATYSTYPYYKDASWSKFINKDEKVLVLDTKILNIGTTVSDWTSVTCIDYSYNYITTPVYWNTPIIWELDFENNLVRFTENNALDITSTLWTKNLSCKVDNADLIAEWNELNNTLALSFDVVDDVCTSFYSATCGAGWPSCPAQCTNIVVYGTSSSVYYKPGDTNMLLWTFNIDIQWADVLVNEIYFKRFWSIGISYVNNISLISEDGTVYPVEIISNAFWDYIKFKDIYITGGAALTNSYKIIWDLGWTIVNDMESFERRISSIDAVKASDGAVIIIDDNDLAYWHDIISVSDDFCETFQVRFDCMFGGSSCFAQCTYVEIEHETSDIDRDIIPWSQDIVVGEFNLDIVWSNMLLDTITVEQQWTLDTSNFIDLTLSIDGSWLSYICTFIGDICVFDIWDSIDIWSYDITITSSILNGATINENIMLNIISLTSERWFDGDIVDVFTVPTNYSTLTVIENSLPDLTISDLDLAYWYGTTYSTFQVSNFGQADYIWDLELSFKNHDLIATEEYRTEAVSLLGDNANNVVWRSIDNDLMWFTESNIYRVEAEVNPTQTITEQDYTNNILQKNMCVDFWEAYSSEFVDAHDFACDNGVTSLGCDSSSDVIDVIAWEFNSCVLKSNWNVDCRWHNSFWESEDYLWWDATQVSAWFYHTCILKSDWNVDCRWDNEDGRGNIVNQSDDYLWWDAIQVSASNYYTCILKNNWNVECRWDNSYWQSEPYLWWDAIEVNAWYYHTCVLKNDWNVYCWGSNSWWESIDYTWWDVVDLEAWYQHTCILKNDWNVDCWGSSYRWETTDYTWWDGALIWWDYTICVLKENWNIDCSGLYIDDYLWWDAVDFEVGWSHICILKEDWNVECNSNTIIYHGQDEDYFVTENDLALAQVCNQMTRAQFAVSLERFVFDMWLDTSATYNASAMCNFDSMGSRDSWMSDGVDFACKAGLMWCADETYTVGCDFESNQAITREEMASAISRLIRGNTNGGLFDYWQHINALDTNSVIDLNYVPDDTIHRVEYRKALDQADQLGFLTVVAPAAPSTTIFAPSSASMMLSTRVSAHSAEEESYDFTDFQELLDIQLPGENILQPVVTEEEETAPSMADFLNLMNSYN